METEEGRLPYYWSLLWRPWKGVVMIVYTVAGLYDLYLGQFVGRLDQDNLPLLYEVMPKWGLGQWGLISVILLLAIVLEA